MKILVIMSLWTDKNAVGNTFSNWLGGEAWNNDLFSNLCWRAQQPDNRVCTDYYRVTDLELLKKCLTPENIGEHFQYHGVPKQETGTQNNEKKLIAWLHRYSFHWIYATMEMLQRNVRWTNHRFAEYLTEFMPDIVFTTAGSIGIIPRLIQCIRRDTNAKIVYYLSDDIYGKYQTYPFYRRRPLMRHFRWALQHADKLYGASELLCEEYGKKFGVEITPLYKGCAFSPMREKHPDVVKLVYAGNLFYGRQETLGLLAEAIRDLNRVTPRAMLEIYTGTPVSEELRKKLEIPGACRIMGQRPYEQIREILNRADIVLHVESFQQEQIDYVHYSFSTKIIDCLQSGSVTMAIGPAGIASVEYVRAIPGAVVIDDLGKIPDMLGELLENKTRFPEMAEQTREFAAKNHDIHRVRESLRADFAELLKADG